MAYSSFLEAKSIGYNTGMEKTMSFGDDMKNKIIKCVFASALSVVILSGCAPVSQNADPEKKTLDSLTKADDGIYCMDFYADYKVDEYLKANITDVTRLDTWLTGNLTHGVPTGDIPDMGCSSFAVNETSGDHLFARNYDMDPGESLIIRTVPANGYASVGIVDLSYVNLGSHGDYDINDEEAKSLLLAAPWCICDGINEKGLGISLLDVNDPHEVENTSKDDLLIYSSLRVILDKCASVDEAIDIYNSFDMYSPRHHSYNVFITDSSGRSVVVEWADGKTYVIEDTAITNFQLCQDKSSLDADQRYAKIHKKIDGVASMTSEEAMGVLKFVSRDTRWSAVYDLEKFSVEICFNGDYSKSYTFEGIRSGG